MSNMKKNNKKKPKPNIFVGINGDQTIITEEKLSELENIETIPNDTKIKNVFTNKNKNKIPASGGTTSSSLTYNVICIPKE